MPQRLLAPYTRSAQRHDEALAPDGQLPVHVPANDDHPSHATPAEVAQESPFREALGGFVRRT